MSTTCPRRGTVVGHTRLKLRVRWDKTRHRPTLVYPTHVRRLRGKEDLSSSPATPGTTREELSDGEVERRQAKLGLRLIGQLGGAR